eukprot:3934366-Rhodomonas_salina.2
MQRERAQGGGERYEGEWSRDRTGENEGASGRERPESLAATHARQLSSHALRVPTSRSREHPSDSPRVPTGPLRRQNPSPSGPARRATV